MGKRGFQNFPPGQRGHQLEQAFPHRCGLSRGGRDQNRPGFRIVFGLREQIAGEVFGRHVLAVADDHDLARPRERIDADDPVHLPLGFGDVGVAGSGDLDDLRE